MSEENNEARERFAAVAREASDEEIDRLASAMHLGTTLLGMIESIAATREMMLGKMTGEEIDEGAIASTTIIGHKASGNLFHICVSSASKEDAEAHTAMLGMATELGGEPVTKH